MPENFYPFSLPSLPYDADALLPYISPETLIYHHNKHYAKYIEKLNASLQQFPKYQARSIEELIRHSYVLPHELQQSINQNAGGVYNHNLYFKSMTDSDTAPSDNITAAADDTFGGIKQMLTSFYQKSLNLFGSGYCFLCCDKNHALYIVTTPNQCTTLTLDLYPLLVCDLWEHSYYLDYKNEKGDYINAFIKIINWDFVNLRYQEAIENPSIFNFRA